VAGTLGPERHAVSAFGPLRVLVTGGGTGGHVYPGLAVADALVELAPAAEVRFAGTRRGLEAVVVPRAGYRLHLVPASGFRGLGSLARLLFVGNFALGVLRSLVLMLGWRPAVVLGTGGFVGGPVMTAARLLGVPCALQEQNAVPGSANRLAGRWARRVYLGFAAAASGFRSGSTVTTGNPVRAGLGAPRPAQGERSVRRLLVFGGSRGARTLNRALEAAAEIWRDRADLELLIQTGPEDHDRVAAAWSAAAGVRVTGYIEDMPAALAWADLVVCRAGAMTLAELQAAGLPAVIVPFPHATDDHQTRNAESCREAGAALLLKDEDCDGPALTAMVDGLLAEPARLAEMGRAAHGLARPRAAQVIAADLLNLIGHPAGRLAEGD
jgi:UDP-N-acetylglucosamine--N-acetylmuramyl-(pentapeptide) pyrophosphoryl-undecaprenol N-acetylglucosamine transferase